MYTLFVKSVIATLEKLLNWMVVQPSRAFKLPGNHELTIGAPADMALFDIDHEHTVTADEFASKGVNTPFIGATIYGQTLLTVVDGQIAYEA